MREPTPMLRRVNEGTHNWNKPSPIKSRVALLRMISAHAERDYTAMSGPGGYLTFHAIHNGKLEHIALSYKPPMVTMEDIQAVIDFINDKTEEDDAKTNESHT